MREEDIRPGMLVRTNGEVGVLPVDKEGEELLVPVTMLKYRAPAKYGVVMHSIPGHDTWAWHVDHVAHYNPGKLNRDQSTQAVYLYWEFDPADIDDLFVEDRESVYAMQLLARRIADRKFSEEVGGK